jgi:hypothetical protein
LRPRPGLTGEKASHQDRRSDLRELWGPHPR